jgi:hypothetical protein
VVGGTGQRASGARYTDDTLETCIYWGEASGRSTANGTGMAIGAGTSGPASVFKHLELHTNPANCITGVSGKPYGSEPYRCSQNADYWRFSAGALQTITEAKVAWSVSSTTRPWSFSATRVAAIRLPGRRASGCTTTSS